jgi:glycosyltransferase involved in cell wall biosynthesis
VIGNEGSCGLLVAAGDAAELAQAMRTLALAPARRATMGAAARARIEREFTWAASAQRLTQALQL